MANEPIVMAIIERRKRANLSQEKLASMAGVSLKTYQRIERGEADIKMSQYRSLTRSLALTDLDLVMDTLEASQTSAEDVAAVSRLLSDEQRKLLIKLILSFVRGR
ncbi:helix-turn-helix transcriptional regulator [Vibrio sp. D404a]|uniref:helix-turn-helix transcriptional regulator n=1 Tax=unclassified Vibrio TaxID=2614977 RepID=UPI002556052E|nr:MULTISPECIES: helix-turn-helix transcriptional regulator [unclassified Vibrio]MDK9737992.1 helix-turn-helix transcriptional regulator [Vibrio sp. D404a]MDK9796283.1 helix-turn-helix transcriptional regulator [Vibrio sp. D449a]